MRHLKEDGNVLRFEDDGVPTQRELDLLLLRASEDETIQALLRVLLNEYEDQDGRNK